MKTFISDFKKLLPIFESVAIDKKTDAEFRQHINKDNLSRFVILIIIAIISQLMFIFWGFLSESGDMLLSRFYLIAIEVILILVFYFLGKKKEYKHSIFYHQVLIILIQMLSFAMGFYFTVNLFLSGIYSFSAFLVVLFIFTMTYTHKPNITSIFQAIFFILLTLYVHYFILNISEWYKEFWVASIFLIFIFIGSRFNYKRQLKVYLQDKKITKQNEKLKMLLQFDDLTGIYNRKEIFKQIEQQVSISQRYKTPFCITILDIDHFKHVNDTYGHNIGDDVLKEFAKKIKSMLRNTDMFGRWGGEEFIIILPNSKAEDAYSFIERIRKSIEEFSFPTIDTITFSAGISMYNNETNASEIAKKADSAMYMAKEAGRNQTKIYKVTK